MNRARYNAVIIAALVLLALAAIIIIEQRITWGVWWSWDQVLHHENFALVLAAVAAGMLVIAGIARRRK